MSNSNRAEARPTTDPAANWTAPIGVRTATGPVIRGSLHFRRYDSQAAITPEPSGTASLMLHADGEQAGKLLLRQLAERRVTVERD